MEWFLAICGMLLAATVLVLLIRESGQAALAAVFSLAVGALVLGRLVPRLGAIFDVFSGVAEQAGLNSNYLGVLLKILAISYVAEFAAALCRDAGEAAYATKLELAGKLAVITLGVPIIVNMLNSVLAILP